MSPPSPEATGDDAPEILTAQDFLARALDRLGIESVLDASPVDRARIMNAFHLERCDDAQTLWLSQLDLPEEQLKQVEDMLVVRGGEMRYMADLLLLGHCSTGQEIEGFESLMSD